MGLMEQIRCDISKLEQRGLTNLADVSLLADLLSIESHLMERERKNVEEQRKSLDAQSNSGKPSDMEEELSTNGQFDQNINRLYKSYMKRRESCLTKMDEESKQAMNRALGLLLGELRDLLETLYSSAVYQDDREMLKTFADNLKDILQ